MRYLVKSFRFVFLWILLQNFNIHAQLSTAQKHAGYAFCFGGAALASTFFISNTKLFYRVTIVACLPLLYASGALWMHCAQSVDKKDDSTLAIILTGLTASILLITVSEK